MNKFRALLCQYFGLLPREQVERLLHLVREDERNALTGSSPPTADSDRLETLLSQLVEIRGRRITARHGQLMLDACIAIPHELLGIGDSLAGSYLAARISREVERQLCRHALSH